MAVQFLPTPPPSTISALVSILSVENRIRQESIVEFLRVPSATIAGTLRRNARFLLRFSTRDPLNTTLLENTPTLIPSRSTGHSRQKPFRHFPPRNFWRFVFGFVCLREVVYAVYARVIRFRYLQRIMPHYPLGTPSTNTPRFWRER